jgi:ribosomal protein L7/L12
MEPWMWIVAVVVLLVLVPWATKGIRPKAPQSPVSVAPRSLTPAESAEIDALVAGDRKIAAIKRLRELQSLSLQEAKDAIDAWVPGTVWTADAVASAPRPTDALSPAARAEIAALIADEQKISAIKRYREETGVGLKQAKDAIENW